MAYNQQYQAFNKLQSAFFTNIVVFNRFTNYEINQHSFMLYNNITKAFPTQGLKYMFYNHFMKFNEMPSLLRALQHKYVNNFTRARIPQGIYFKAGKKIKQPKSRKKKTKTTGLIDFDEHIIFDICSIMMIDAKTYQTIKFSTQVQSIGKQIIDEFNDTIIKNITEQNES